MPTYTITEDETAFWSDMAALLDPGAYEWVLGDAQTRTVPAGETWYLQEGWWLQASGGGAHWFHRAGDVRDAVPLPPGTVLTTATTAQKANSHMYICKPALVTAADGRYSSDPRGLYFERLRRLANELTLYQIGGTETGSSSADGTFPTDFNYGMVVHVSIHDIAWLIPRDAAELGGIITQPEISDTDPFRYANNVLIPFSRGSFPKVRWRGASSSEGRGTLTYAKLPVDW